jgi:N-acetylglucosamine kinase-like BadF-type ATPase
MMWGEGAGALELSIRASQMVIAQWLRTGPETRLSDLFMETFSAKSLANLVEGIVLRHYPVTADLAPSIFEVAREGDEPANGAVRWAASKLADLAIGAARQLELEEQHFEIILSGSFYKAGEILIEPMKEKVLKVAPLAEFFVLDIPPVCGGVMMAMIKSGSVAVNQIGEIKEQFRGYFKP